MHRSILKTSFILSLVAVLTALSFGFNPGLNGSFFTASVSQAATNLNGRILLQVQDKGQAWYVNPLDGRRYYLGRPADAFSLMRSLGLGVTNSDIQKFQGGAPSRLGGRILLQVQDKGQAYYVDPQTLRLHYLGRPADAFSLMRSQGLGITDIDLARIPAFTAESAPASQSTSFDFKYQNVDYSITHDLSASWYERYKDSPKVYTYSSASPPPNLRDAFYNLFLSAKSGDTAVSDLAAKLKAEAEQHSWSGDELVEFSMALVQYIPYDHDKLVESDNRNTNPYYPYETLYLKRGVCSDKTFLAVALLRELGYGAAILDFPDSNHSAVGIACPSEYSVNGSGYCYGETTNYFPLGVVPRNISSGQAQTQEGFSGSFDALNLGEMEIYQKSAGRIYGGVAATRALVSSIEADQADLKLRQVEIGELEDEYRKQEAELIALRARLDAYYASGQLSAYNQLVSEYNDKVKQYNAGLAAYQLKVDNYNQKAVDLNQAVKEFYQK